MDAYLAPLAETPDIAAAVETGAKVTAIGRLGIDKVVSKGREERPFALSVAGMGCATSPTHASSRAARPEASTRWDGV